MVRRAIVCGLLCCLAACGGDSPVSPAHDWIEIASITPPRGSTLAPAQRVTFVLTVSVTLASTDGGYAVLVISDHGNRTLNNPAGPEARVRLARGTRTVTLTDAITAPESGWTVNAAAALFIDGSNQTAMLQKASFLVQ